MYIPKPLDDKVTIPHLKRKKQEGEKFACLTAYDYSFAGLVEDCGVEVVLVGDSLGMVIQGHETTIPVTLDDICYHGKAVAAGLQNAMLMLDMPFGSLNSPQQAIDNASYLLKQTQAQVVKLEGGQTQLKTVETLAKFGIASCSHLGLQPQMVHKMGGYRVQGKARSAAEEMLATAKDLEAAGTDLLLLGDRYRRGRRRRRPDPGAAGRAQRHRRQKAQVFQELHAGPVEHPGCDQTLCQ
jgi:3-methyl-2-oxobutanoate hydroxymethyltransferase